MRARGRPEADFSWADGVRVSSTAIWCDARRRQQLCFVSHAGQRLSWPGAGRAKVVTTERTVVLFGEPAGELLVTPYARPFALGRLRLELLPSGRLPGAAQLLVERPGRRVLYAGDLNPRSGRLAEPAQVRAADAVCFAAPLAPLLRALPEREEVEAALIAEVRAAVEDGLTPVVLAPALGAAAEVAALLGAAGIPLRAHSRLARLLGRYVRIGCFVRTPAKTLRGAPAAGEAVLWPLELHRSPSLAKLARARLLLAGAAALDPAALALTGAARGFALSDHGDLPSLIAHALAAGARDVYFAAGYTDEVARAFTARRLRCHPLGPPEQMTLFPA